MRGWIFVKFVTRLLGVILWVGLGTDGARAALPTSSYTTVPQWWQRRQITADQASPDDFGLLNQGQLKQMALAAFVELEEILPGGSGTALTQLLDQWTQVGEDGVRVPRLTSETDDFAIVNLGQLKETARLFYDRLAQEGLVRARPWGWVEQDDFAPVNVGQAKAVFAFETNLNADANLNNLPDLWELSMFGHLGVDPDVDADGDGISNRQEFLERTDPTDYFNGRIPSVMLVSGTYQEGSAESVLSDFLALRVTDALGVPLVNAPVLFELIKGQSGELSDPTSSWTGGGRLVVTFTNSEGLAQVRFQLPSEDDFWCLVKATAGGAGAVFFQSRTLPKNDSGSEAALLRAHVPEFSLDGGAYLEKVEVRLTCGTPGAVVHYTLNGEDPTEKDPSVSTDGFVEVGEPVVLKARAFLKGRNPSEIKSAAFRIGPSMWSTNAHSFALDEAWTLWAWGANEHGQLGLGHRTDQNAPVPLQRLGDVLSASAGSMHGLAILWDGKVLSWGANFFGQLGREGMEDSPFPLLVAQVPYARAVAAGGGHSVTLCGDGSVWSWGRNASGQVGNGSTASVHHPARVAGLRRVRAIGAGEEFTLALCADGTVWAWGQGMYGQLGNGSLEDVLVPQRVQSLSDCIAVSAGSGHALALRSDGSVWAWGNNANGQLGTGDTIARSIPVRVGGLLEKARSIEAGPSSSTALLAENMVMYWGRRDLRKNGDSGGDVKVPEPLTRATRERISGGDGALALYGRELNGVGRRDAGSTQGGPGTRSAGDGSKTDAATPSSFELKMRMFADWSAEPEIYDILVSISYRSENGGVFDYWYWIESTLLVFYSAFLESAKMTDSFRFKGLELLEREFEGSYQGPPATTFEELEAREYVWASGDVEVQVEISAPDPAKGTRCFSFNPSYNHRAFFYDKQSFLVEQENGVEVDFGSTVRLRCPSISSKVIQGYKGEERVSVRLSSVLPDGMKKQIDETYLLFKQKSGSPTCQLLGSPMEAVLIFNTDEKVEYILCPVVLLQRNYPTSQGTTDLGPSELRTILNTDNGTSTAWIRGDAEMADLEIKIGDGSIGGLTVDWALDVRSERPERGTLDNLHLPAGGDAKILSLSSDKAWKLSEELNGIDNFVGGLCTVSYAIKSQTGDTLCPARDFRFRIRGKNPKDESVIDHILTHPSYSRFAWAMVQHESRQGARGTYRVYNQFNSGGPTRELPNFSGNAPKEDGWGIAQLDKPLGKRAASGEVYSWRKNLDKFQRELELKEKTAELYVQALRSVYMQQGIWEELPEPFMRKGTTTPMSSLEAAVIQLYNGAAWLVEIKGGKIIYDGPYTSTEHGGSRYISCWRFIPQNPAGARWEFKPNKNNYLYKVVRDEWEGNLWYQE